MVSVDARLINRSRGRSTVDGWWLREADREGRAVLSTGRVILIVLGSIVALLGLGLAGGGGFLLWTDLTQREDGYLTTPTEQFATSTYALTREKLEVDAGGSNWIWNDNWLGKVRIRAEGASSRPLFIGIGPEPASGQGRQTVTWKVREGDWSVVLMNADGSRGVAAEVDLGAKVSFLLWVAIGVLIGGVLLLGGGVALIVLAARRGPPPVAPPTPATTTGETV